MLRGFRNLRFASFAALLTASTWSISQASGSNTVTTLMGNFGGPSAVAVNPATNYIYVSNLDFGTVSVVDGANNTVSGISHPYGGSSTGSIAVSAASNVVYVLNPDNSIDVVDGNPLSPTFNVPLSTITLPSPPNDSVFATGIAFNAASNTLYVAAELAGVDLDSIVYSINFNSSPPTIGTIRLPRGVLAIAVDPVLNRVYLTQSSRAYQAGAVYVLDTALNPPGVLTTITVGVSPTAIAVNTQTGSVYVANRDDPGYPNPGPFGNYGSISVINGNANPPILVTTVFDGLISGPWDLAVDAAANRLYFTSAYAVGQFFQFSAAGVVSSIDTSLNVVTSDNFAVGTWPQGIAYDSVNNTLYVANYDSLSVSAISLGPVSPTTIPALETFIQNSPQVAAGLNKGQKNSLTVKLQDAGTSFAGGNIKAGCGQLGAFMNEIAGVEQSGRLDAITAATLLSGAQTVETANSCS